jgi:hypothetical protein
MLDYYLSRVVVRVIISGVLLLAREERPDLVAFKEPKQTHCVPLSAATSLEGGRNRAFQP